MSQNICDTRYSIKFIYPNIYLLLQLHALIPVSIAGAERSFSTLKLNKTYLQNRINDERLSDLAVINIHKNIAQELNIENVVDEFAKSKCRLSFTNEFNQRISLFIIYFLIVYFQIVWNNNQR